MLQLDHLRQLRSPTALADVYHLLGYPADQEAPAYTPDEIDLGGAAGQDVRQVWLLVDLGEGTGSLQHVHFEVADLQAGTLRRITEVFLKRPGEYLLSFAPANFERLVFIKPRREGTESATGQGSRLKLGKLTVQPSRPTQHDLSVLRELALDPHTTSQQAHLKQIKAFNVERVTRKFFDEYKALFGHTRDTVSAENRNARIGMLARNTVEDKPSLHAFTQRLLGRIIFLYFIQKKGWLNHNPDFLADLYQQATTHPGGNFYRDALEILFFEVLNTQRPGNASSLGEIPYLNGSLFEREYPDTTVLNLPNSLFDPRTPGSILNVLGGYNFTVSESGTLDQEISLDPEMLGKVFENMMEEEEAAQSGTFYTPRSIVQFMAEETLTRYLADHTGLAQDCLLGLLADAAPEDQPEATAGPITFQDADRIIRALGEVRVLDPAVGTASMLVGFLNAMIRVRRSAAAIRGTHVTEGSPDLANWKREYIQHCLYGVDIKQEAIEIARLRLWLSLVVDAKHPEPLPNLDYKLMAGDGLLETVDGTPFLKVEQAFVGPEALVAEKAHQIEAKHEQFFGEQRPEQRRALRHEIQALERELFRADVDHRISGLDGQIRILDGQIAHPTLGERSRATLAKRRTALADNMRRLIDQKIKVWDEQEPLPFFLHNVHFAEVMKGDNRGGNGGFDIVIGNPPYVSIGNMQASYKTALKQAFPDVESGRADLYVYFYQKGLNLLRRGGRLAYITPNKFMRAGYGEKLRGVLSGQTRLELLADFGDLPVFDATTYPLIALFQKATPEATPIQMLPERTLKAHLGPALDGGVPTIREALNGFHVYARSLMAPLDARELSTREWTLDDPRVLRLMDKLKNFDGRINQFLIGKISAGIKSGLNTAFIIDEVTKDILSSDGISGDTIKPYIRGRFVRQNRIEWPKEYIIYVSKNAKIDDYPNVRDFLSARRSELEARATADSHQWYELQQPQAAFHKDYGNIKIIYPDISQTPRFSLDTSGLYPDMTLFCAPIGKEFTWLVHILNSKVSFFYIKLTSPSIMGSSYRFKTQYIEQLPIPTPTPEQAATLETFTDDSRLDELNALVYELYGLTPSEIALVESLTAGAYAGAGGAADADLAAEAEE